MHFALVSKPKLSNGYHFCGANSAFPHNLKYYAMLFWYNFLEYTLIYIKSIKWDIGPLNF